ncbi:hypothetical protein [Paraburkholderia bannensis]|uniref:hypothetical protein n=1 Tax=Paraburkholderia bannensis TaxID=765414 RepID=UPI000489A34F|nr:hypothetical protein [Paraburkholderia bannensis]
MKLDQWQAPLFALFVVICGAAFFHWPIEHSSDVAAWVQAVGSVGAIIIAVWVFHRQYLDAERRSQDEVHAFVQAIREEVSAVWEGYSTGARNRLLAVQENQFFNALFPVTTEAFTVYNRTSSQVGKVDDEELRRLIIVTYAKAKGLIYSFQLNNHLVTDLINFEASYHGQDREIRFQHKVNELVRYAGELKNRDTLVHESLNALLHRADEWLRANRTHR